MSACGHAQATRMLWAGQDQGQRLAASTLSGNKRNLKCLKVEVRFPRQCGHALRLEHSRPGLRAINKKQAHSAVFSQKNLAASAGKATQTICSKVFS